MRRQPAKEWDQYNVGNPGSWMWWRLPRCLYGWRLRYPKRLKHTVDGSEIRRSPVDIREYPEISQGFIDNRWLFGMSSINYVSLFPAGISFSRVVGPMWSFPGGRKGHGKQGGFCSVFFSRQFQGRTFCPGRWVLKKVCFWFTPWWK